MEPQAEKAGRGTGRIHVREAKFVLGAPSVRGLPPPRLAEVAVMGRSNVGKSSLLNFLCGRKLARVSNTPGRTRELNLFELELLRGVDHRTLHLVDLPGYGFAAMSHAEKKRVSQALSEYAQADRHRAVLLLLDVRREPNDDDREVAAALREARGSVVAVVTKADKLAKSKRVPAAAAIARALGLPPGVVRVTSVMEELGREALLQVAWDAAEAP
ncbi:MAG: ribosome biogenesis GTP-binding protein YsxC [Deltaproteobacteria bacterium]|nr:ribosome biogenesis GTP-binding protein YsxC [Deltaproteobacteria bacterium]